MPKFSSIDDLRAAVSDLPAANHEVADQVAGREAQLTKPPGSLGRLEDLTAWLAAWQGQNPPRLEVVEILVFAGNHGVTAQGVSAYPAEVTAQMVANFAAEGAAINQLTREAKANLRVMPLSLDTPTADFTEGPAMAEAEFLEAVSAGYEAVPAAADLLVLGEMGIGNTTAAAALSGALFGGGARFAGTGTGVDDAGLKRKRDVIERALQRHSGAIADPLHAAAALGGRELAAMFGACLAARHNAIPVLIDGFVSTAAVAPLKALRADALDHAHVGHVSAEAGHCLLLRELGMTPLLDLGMRLGEGSGAAVAVLVLRAALACHTGMATFEEAQVSDKQVSDKDA
ncbi:MAG: nicotinate-nucleotide--dimethylbenzimidazole phosphoribosyltransferase [Alphaproteobacteria bacterium]|jgi:nicotinate-nucleotide--dimethylbenzimidazole phosphoribosyltransferase|uniref:nicotinate-nucleotide--dimethylbenzimidazole phosphoribosyltransferase n=1 Tax=Methyloceanibacter sp. TaxID=1965321 RepID=UPI0035670BBA